MAKHAYTIASEEGAALVNRKNGVAVDVGEQVDVDLSVDEQRAVVAAGWLEPVEEAQPKKEEKK